MFFKNLKVGLIDVKKYKILSTSYMYTLLSIYIYKPLHVRLTIKGSHVPHATCI